MGLLSSLNERLVTRREGTGNQIKVDDNTADSLLNSDISEISKFIDKLKTNSKKREDLYNTYDVMAQDSIIGSAIELIADDAIQPDSFQKKSVWVTSKDKELELFINNYLADIKIEDKLWGYAYNLVKYGEVFLETHFTEFSELKGKNKVDESLKLTEKEEVLVSKLGRLFEVVDKPANIVALEKYGDLVAFGKKGDSNNYTLYPTMDYIHILNDRGLHREPVKISYLDKKGEKTEEEFKIKYGTASFESARQAWAILDLIETLILHVRFGRSAFYRIFSVEVGGASRTEVLKILRQVKQAMSATETLDIKEGSYVGSRKPIPHGENIYIPVKAGKGEVTINSEGGDADIKEIVDLEYWRNKLFAALKVPKAYLGFEESQPGGLGNMSLTRMDIRYARSVKCVNGALKRGIRDMIDFFLTVSDKEDSIGEYEVNMTEIMSAEVSDKKEDMLSDIALSEALMGLLTDKEGIDTAKLTKIVIEKILQLPNIYPELFPEEEEIAKS